MRTLRIGIAAVAAALVLAACVPDPPPADPAPPGVTLVTAPLPTTTTTTTAPPPALPPTPVGATAPALDPNDAPDPFVVSVDPSFCTPPAVPGAADPVPPTACYFAYTTQVYLLIVPVWRSTDLATWTRVSDPPVSGNAMPTLASWATYGHNWAPAVLERPANPPESRFVMWYTAADTASGSQCLGVATAAMPSGPFVDHADKPAYCPTGRDATIDPSPFVDDDGTSYLVYRSGIPTRLWSARLTPDGTAIVGGTEHPLLNGGAPDADVVEAPTMIRVGGALYLFYSTDSWWTASYRVGVAICDTVAGPCTRKYGTAVLASRGTMVGPGGQTPFRDAQGQWQMIFHAWTDPKVGYPTGARSLRLLPITIDATDVKIG